MMVSLRMVGQGKGAEDGRGCLEGGVGRGGGNLR